MIYDVIVLGGGHAGVEAASASARLGCSTMLITHDASKIGTMSCNPAIGGLGKGHLVREIDALGGVMGKAIDQSGIQFKMLNASKGPAVWGPRSQADRSLYKKAVQYYIKQHENLTIISRAVKKLHYKNGLFHHVVLHDDDIIMGHTCVLTTGTFLGGRIFIGKNISHEAGRYGEKSDKQLSQSFAELALPLGRLKTGTPPRLDAKTLNFELCTKQYGDAEPVPFSYDTDVIKVPQVLCYSTQTNKKTHEIIERNLQESAMYGGVIESKGPRYCPSIEDKIVRFKDKDSHQIFLEPEGLKSDVIYPNGISTSLPLSVQEDYVRSIRGCEHAKILQPGYAVEYDYVDSRSLGNCLQVKTCPNLFLAGQINGSTGYEEAGGQGIIAGINAGLYAQSQEAFIVHRSNSYIGVMIDDLTTHGADEPYRMFTARAEYRLRLRADNADQRLTKLGYDIGAVSQHQWQKFNSKMGKYQDYKSIMQSNIFTENRLKPLMFHVKQVAPHASVKHDGKKRTAYDLLGFTHWTIEAIKILCPQLCEADHSILKQISYDALYEGYLIRQENDIHQYKKSEKMLIPSSINFHDIGGLSTEVQERLAKTKPQNMGQISRIQGITPSAMVAIMRYVKSYSLQ